MNNNFQITFTLTPTFDVAKFNTILSQFKKSLGEHGKDIKLLDEQKINAALQGADTGVRKLGTELQNTAAKGKEAGSTIQNSISYFISLYFF